MDVTLSQMPVKENSLLHVIGVHHLQLLSRSRKKGKYDNAKEDRRSKPLILGQTGELRQSALRERRHTIKLGTGKTSTNNTREGR